MNAHVLFETAFMLVLAAPIVSTAADPRVGDRSGKAVVDAVCYQCHGTDAYGAPRIGDNKAWQERSARGLSSLTQNALKGIRNMPAHGGSPDVSDLEISRAITYMVNQSGGHWIEPTSKGTAVAERTGRQVVEARCTECHKTGKGGAPRIGDRSAWIPRLSQGLDATVRSAIHGHGGMPARGGIADFTDTEIRRAIVYMFNPDTGAAK